MDQLPSLSSTSGYWSVATAHHDRDRTVVGMVSRVRLDELTNKSILRKGYVK